MNELTHIAPAPHVKGHTGEPLDESLCIFADAPAEIGDVISAGSNIRQDDAGVQSSGQLSVPMMWSVLLWGALMFGSILFNVPMQYALAASAVAAVCVICTSLYWSRVRPQVTFVGTNGMAVGVFRGQQVAWTICRYAAIQDSFTNEMIHESVNHQYGGSSFSFEWCDSSDRTLMDFHGAHYAGTNQSGMEDLYYFGHATEAQWMAHDYERRMTELRQAKRTEFTLRGFGTVVVEPDAVVLNINRRAKKFDHAAQLHVQICEGIMYFYPQGNERGKESFALRYLASWRNFVSLLQSELGIEVAC